MHGEFSWSISASNYFIKLDRPSLSIKWMWEMEDERWLARIRLLHTIPHQGNNIPVTPLTKWKWKVRIKYLSSQALPRYLYLHHTFLPHWHINPGSLSGRCRCHARKLETNSATLQFQLPVHWYQWQLWQHCLYLHKQKSNAYDKISDMAKFDQYLRPCKKLNWYYIVSWTHMCIWTCIPLPIKAHPQKCAFLHFF